jgi:hypothetical protein
MLIANKYTSLASKLKGGGGRRMKKKEGDWW